MKSNRYSKILLVIALMVISSIPAFAFRGYVAEKPGGAIAWGNGEMSCSRTISVDQSRFDAAHQTALAIRKAAVDARRQLLDMVQDVRIDSSTTVGLYLNENEDAATAVRRLVHNSKLDRPELIDGDGELVASISMRGELADLVLPATIPFESGIAPRLELGVDSLGAMNTVEPTDELAGAATYTGLVVDASAYSRLVPALCPVIYGRNGQGVYGAFRVSRTSAIRNGVASYSWSADRIVLRDRVGDRPLVVQALGVVGSGRTDVIISGADARLVEQLMRDQAVREECRVVIVMGDTLGWSLELKPET